MNIYERLITENNKEFKYLNNLVNDFIKEADKNDSSSIYCSFNRDFKYDTFLYNKYLITVMWNDNRCKITLSTNNQLSSVEYPSIIIRESKDNKIILKLNYIINGILIEPDDFDKITSKEYLDNLTLSFLINCTKSDLEIIKEVALHYKYKNINENLNQLDLLNSLEQVNENSFYSQFKFKNNFNNFNELCSRKDELEDGNTLLVGTNIYVFRKMNILKDKGSFKIIGFSFNANSLDDSDKYSEWW